jgi:hypothetical protein
MKFKAKVDLRHVPSMEPFVKSDKGLVKAGTEFSIGTGEELKVLEDSERILVGHLTGAQSVERILPTAKTEPPKPPTPAAT